MQPLVWRTQVQLRIILKAVELTQSTKYFKSIVYCYDKYCTHVQASTLMKLVSFPQKPYVTVEKYRAEKPIKYAGYLMELWTELERRMNFTWEIYVNFKNEISFGTCTFGYPWLL